LTEEIGSPREYSVATDERADLEKWLDVGEKLGDG
jgi:hypothetical protein